LSACTVSGNPAAGHDASIWRSGTARNPGYGHLSCKISSRKFGLHPAAFRLELSFAAAIGNASGGLTATDGSNTANLTLLG
jgi:hypothetical protein